MGAISNDQARESMERVRIHITQTFYEGNISFALIFLCLKCWLQNNSALAYAAISPLSNVSGQGQMEWSRVTDLFPYVSSTETMGRGKGLIRLATWTHAACGFQQAAHKALRGRRLPCFKWKPKCLGASQVRIHYLSSPPLVSSGLGQCGPIEFRYFH